MLKLQNVSFENRVIVAINCIYVIIPIFLNLFGPFGPVYDEKEWWELFVFWWSIPLINALLYWIISGYKKEKGTRFSFIAKLIIALWFWIFVFGLVVLLSFF